MTSLDQVIEKDAETDRKKAVIEAEKEAQVAKIRYFIIQSQLHLYLYWFLHKVSVFLSANGWWFIKFVQV